MGFIFFKTNGKKRVLNCAPQRKQIMSLKNCRLVFKISQNATSKFAKWFSEPLRQIIKLEVELQKGIFEAKRAEEGVHLTIR